MVDLDTDWSDYPMEEEVMLMPFFCFQVLRIRDHTDPYGIRGKIITIIEIPKQNLLERRRIDYSKLIWADPLMNK